MHRLRLTALTAVLLLMGSPSLALDARDVPVPPTDLAVTVEVEKDTEGSIKFYNGTLSWNSHGNATWLAAAEFTIEKRAVGTTEWREHLPRRYYSTFNFTWGLGTLMFGNTYEVRIIERAGGFDTGYSEIIRFDVPMPVPEITKLETQPDPIPPGHADQIFMTVYGKHFQWDLFYPENKPARVLWDGEELPGFDAGSRIVSGWVAAEHLTTGRHEIQVVQGGVKSKETLYLDIGEVGETVEGLRATADPKKRKVYLDWKALDGADGYKIERREVVDDPVPGAKALEVKAWEALVVLSQKVTKWRDRTGARDKHYQYRIAGLFADDVGQTSNSEDAWIPGKRRKGKVEFDCWRGRWDLTFDGGEVLPGARLGMTAGRTLVLSWGTHGTFTFICDIKSRGRKIRSKSKFQAIDDGGSWHPIFRQRYLDTEVTGKCALWFEGAASDTYGRFYGELNPKKKNGEKINGYTPILVEATAAHDDTFHPPDTELKTTIGFGKRTAKPGQVVAIVVDVSCLGLAPLNGGRIELYVELENGVILEAKTEGRGEFLGNPDNGFFWVTLGDLGPAHGKMGHVERVVVAAVVAGPPGGEMRLRTRLSDLKPGGVPKVILAGERVIEVAIEE